MLFDDKRGMGFDVVTAKHAFFQKINFCIPCSCLVQKIALGCYVCIQLLFVRCRIFLQSLCKAQVDDIFFPILGSCISFHY